MHRIAVRTRSHYLDVVTALLVLTTGGVGLNWTLAPARALSSPAYDTAKLVAPMRLHGLAFLALALVVVIMWTAERPVLRAAAVGVLLTWAWGAWTVLFALAPIGRGPFSYLGALLCLLPCLLSAATGFALYGRHLSGH